VFSGSTNIYIDYANVRPWAERLGWHVDVERLGQFLRAFDTVNKRKMYYGTLEGDAASKHLIKKMEHSKFEVVTKAVKIMKFSIDVSNISADSTARLQSFIRNALLRRLKVEAVTYLNDQLRDLNHQGQFEILDRKCNFDVEIGRDMLLDYERNTCETFILWSGDSDFADPVRQLLKDRKRVYLFATARRVSVELNALRDEGLVIFDIRKIKDFICRSEEMGSPMSGAA